MLNASTGIVLDANAEHGPQHAHYLGQACGLAYLNEKDGAEKYRNELNLDVQLISVDNTQAYVCENEESIVIAFRGSESFLTLDGFKDWLLTNARNFLVVPDGRIGTDFSAAGVGARFHRGFMEALAEIWEPLYRAIDSAFSKAERPVWVTGHSLGGALALLCAWRLHQQFIQVHQIVTFGAPMIGNQAAADAYHREFSNKIFRYVDAGDLVPRLPTISLFSDTYQHCQREVMVGDSKIRSAAEVIGNVAEKAEEVVGEALSGQAIEKLWTELRKGMPSHLMGNYMSRISERLG